MIAFLSLALAADANKPHEHQGKFTPYTPGPPDRYGLKLSRSQKAELAKTHKPQMSVEVVEGPDVPKGTMRCTSIQDVDVPPEIVWKLLLDFPAYPKFVGGITACIASADDSARPTVSEGRPCARRMSTDLAASGGSALTCMMTFSLRLVPYLLRPSHGHPILGPDTTALSSAPPRA